MANTYTQLYVQFVFSVKGRENLIKESFRDELEKIISGIIKNHQCKTFAIYCNPDHTHIFVGMQPVISPSKLMEQVKSGSSKWLNENLNTKDVFELYYLKNKLAVQVIENFCENISKGIANICAVVDPDIFIIGGSVVIHNPQIISNIKEKTMSKVHNPQTLKIKVAKFEDDAGLIGASQLI